MNLRNGFSCKRIRGSYYFAADKETHTPDFQRIETKYLIKIITSTMSRHHP
jgi:hypothetical protein